MPSLLDELEDAIVAAAREIDASGASDPALRLADWIIAQLRDGPYRLDPDPAPGDDVEYELHGRQPNGVRLQTRITVDELTGLDAEQRIQTIGLKAVALLTLMEARKGYGQPLGQLEPPEPQTLEEYARDQMPEGLEP